MQCPFLLNGLLLLLYCLIRCDRFVHCLPSFNRTSSTIDKADSLIDCNALTYLVNTTKKDINALASFPGSGNSWLRHLIQQSTGLLTGSVYRDFELENKGLPGVHDSSVIIVKTHQLPSEPFPKFDRAVLLIRNPFKTLLAEFNRRAAGSHLGYIPITKKFLQRKDWVEFVVSELKNWKFFYIKWLEFERPLLVVTYESLLMDLDCQLQSIIHFLQQPVYHPRLLKCALSKPNDRFKSAGHLYAFDPFSIHVNGSSLRRLVEEERRALYRHIENKFESVSSNQLRCKRKSNKVSEDKIG